MPTTLRILTRFKSPKYKTIYQVAVLGGPLHVGAIISIPQLGSGASRGSIDKIIVGKDEVTTAAENSVCAIVIMLRGKIWEGDRKPTLEVLEQSEPTVRTRRITGWMAKHIQNGDQGTLRLNPNTDQIINDEITPWGTHFPTREEAEQFVEGRLDRYMVVEVDIVITERRV